MKYIPALLLTLFITQPIQTMDNAAIIDAAKIARERDEIWFHRTLNPELEPTLHRIELDVDLYEAIGNGNVERAQELLAAGARFGKTTQELYNPETPLMRAVQSPGENIGLCQLLLDHGAKIDEPSGEDEWTPLMQAADNGRMRLCKFLLNRGANMLARDKSNNTALLLVAKKYAFARKCYNKKPIGGLQYLPPDPIVIDIVTNLKRTAQFLIAYQRQQQKSMLTWLACLKYNDLFAMRELYRQRDGLFAHHLKQYLVKTLLEAKNDEGKNLYDYE